MWLSIGVYILHLVRQTAGSHGSLNSQNLQKKIVDSPCCSMLLKQTDNIFDSPWPEADLGGCGCDYCCLVLIGRFAACVTKALFSVASGASTGAM